jgi:hypothetical protein
MSANHIQFKLLSYKDPRWLDFINKHPESHIFHHPAWITTMTRSYGYTPYLAAVIDDQEVITAGTPFMELSNPFNHRRWVSLPFTDHCTPLYEDMNGLDVLEKGIIEEAQRQKVEDLELRWNYQSPELFHSNNYVLSVLQLPSEACKAAKNIKSNDFKKVRIATMQGVQVEKGTSLRQLEIFYQLHLETRQRHGVPVQPWHYFKNLRDELLETGLGFISLAHVNEDYVAGVIYLCWKNTLVYKYAASNKLGRQLSAGDPLVWDAITWGCENGMTSLDFGRTDDYAEGLRRFKKRWGSEENPLYYSRNHELGSNSFEHKIMPIVKTVINKSPLWVCRFSGELLYRFMG